MVRASVEGASRFVKKVWNLVIDKKYIPIKEPNEFSKDEMDLRRKTYSTLKKVTNDFESRFSFNTAIASIMELFNSIPEDFKKNDTVIQKNSVLMNQSLLFLKH
jgi:leucyl-tRNA synthetase